MSGTNLRTWTTSQMSVLSGAAIYLVCTSFFIGYVLAAEPYLKREHSLTKPYQGSGMTIPFWDFGGTTMVTSQFIRLTSDSQSQKGSLWSTQPVNFPNWEVHLSFKIYGHGKDLFGDGMAFWYTKQKLIPGNVFGSADYFTGLGLFIDTYANQNGAHNHGHPYISAMINNGTLSYDHDRDGTHTELAGCESKVRGLDWDRNLLIRYENNVLTVHTDTEGKGVWKDCFTVRDVQLPTGYYFGVTAATGDLSDHHDVIALRTYELDPPATGEDRSHLIPAASHFAAPRDHREDPPPPMSNLKFFFWCLIVVIGLAVLVVVGIFVFQKQQETSRKRFY